MTRAALPPSKPVRAVTRRGVRRGASGLALTLLLAAGTPAPLARAEEDATKTETTGESTAGEPEVDKGAIVAAYKASQAALDEGDVDTAIEQGERALELARQGLGARHKTTGILAYNLATVYFAQERWAEARRSYEAALAGYEGAYGPQSAELIPVLDGLAESMGRLEAYEQAGATFDRSLALTEARYGEDSDEVGELLQKMGLVAQQRGDVDAAMSHGKRALGIFKETRGEQDVQVGLIYFGLGTLAAQSGDIETAQRSIDRGEGILSEALPAGHPYLIGLYDYLADTYKAVGQTSKARRYRRKAEEHREAAEGSEG